MSTVPLLDADPKHEALDPVLWAAEGLSSIELYRMVTAEITLTEEMQQRRARGIAPAGSGPRVPSTNAAIKTILGLDPAVLDRAINFDDRKGMIPRHGAASHSTSSCEERCASTWRCTSVVWTRSG